MDERQEVRELLARLRRALPDLDALKTTCDGHWGAEDGLYRFYHHSFKVYDRLQPLTEAIAARLQRVAPDRPLNALFRQIVAEGTGRTFSVEHNRDWPRETRPIVEAFYHARYFLDMACKYGRELNEPPRLLPSGWAALLSLYDLR